MGFVVKKNQLTKKFSESFYFIRLKNMELNKYHV